MGLIGGPLAFLEGMLVDWGAGSPSVPLFLLIVPEFIWEAFLGIYCAIWGFKKDSPILRPTWRGNASGA